MIHKSFCKSVTLFTGCLQMKSSQTYTVGFPSLVCRSANSAGESFAGGYAEAATTAFGLYPERTTLKSASALSPGVV